MMTMTRIAALLLACATVLAIGCGGSDDDADETPPARVVELLATSETVLGQRIVYPTSTQAEVSSSIVTLQPGENTEWHHHETPLYAYVLEGTITVEYDGDTTRSYEAGTALMEAIGTIHIGRNEGSEQVRILVVNIGAEQLANTVIDD